MKNFCIVYITFPSEEEAERVAKELLERKIIVCSNIFPVKSLYWWKGKIEKANEFVLIAKTLRKNVKRLEMFVKKMHPYTTPFIGVFNIKVNKEYFEWSKTIK
jgi:periplasmic divalent cation tolerance protein